MRQTYCKINESEFQQGPDVSQIKVYWYVAKSLLTSIFDLEEQMGYSLSIQQSLCLRGSPGDLCQRCPGDPLRFQRNSSSLLASAILRGDNFFA